MYLLFLREKIYRVKHLYIYPVKYKEDGYDIFNTCPIKTNYLTYPSVHADQVCFKCKKKQKYCENVGYTWFCRSCHMNQFEMVEDKMYVTINPTIRQNEKYTSNVVWQCKKCNKLQINFFKDRIIEL